MRPDKPPAYHLVDLSCTSEAGPLADETLLQLASHGPVASLWQARQGLVVPRTYAAKPGFTTVQADFARRGWPIYVRQSGGGVVPQGPGIFNLSLAQVFCGRPLDHAEALYRHLCNILCKALWPFGIQAQTQTVEGSFCDGRFNLAVLAPVRKVAGTAQVWRRVAGSPNDRQTGLVHALILAQCDPRALTEQANALELALGTPRRYDADRIASLDQMPTVAGRDDFSSMLQASLHDVLTTSKPLFTDSLSKA